MRAFIFGDTHTGRYFIEDITKASMAVWDWAYDIIQTKKIDAVFFLGDRCRSRDPEGLIRDIADRGLVRLSELVPVYCICGNHDFYFKSGSIENNYGILSKWKNIHVISDNIVVKFGDINVEFLAYGSEPSGRGQYLMMHDEIEGMLHWVKDGVSREKLKSYKKVYSGHIHYRKIDGNMVYVSVPFQQNFGDGKEVGGLILDLNTGKEDWVGGFGPKFITGLTANINGNIVRVETDSEREEALKRGAIWVEVIGKEENEVIKKVEEASMTVGWADWIVEYVKRNNKSDTYINIGNHILDSCQ